MTELSLQDMLNVLEAISELCKKKFEEYDNLIGQMMVMYGELIVVSEYLLDTTMNSKTEEERKEIAIALAEGKQHMIEMITQAASGTPQ